jgi:mono/diheme cytochrome c family protein
MRDKTVVDYRSWRRLRVASVGIFLLFGAGCEWFTDFKRQPSIKTWEQVGDSTVPSRVNPALSVPVTGMAVSGLEVSYRPLPGVIDSMSGLANPVASDERSIANGHRYYQINCVVCHGDRGMGDGPATRYGMPGMSLVNELARGRSDGYLFGMMRNGRGLMPPYNRIEEPDRWDVVNYVRALQGGGDVPAGVIAAPGVTGAALPGATRSAPTVPAPHWGHRLPSASTRADTAPSVERVEPDTGAAP